jgi:outer membrane PBP1 activator LpoA protein
MKKLILTVVLAGVVAGCKTETPAEQAAKEALWNSAISNAPALLNAASQAAVAVDATVQTIKGTNK